jgi:predicted HAD superfamily Cof-like phosphohydrolase
MDDAAEDVREFQERVGHVDGAGVELTTPEIQALYHTFVEEEYKEFMEATDAAHKLQEAMDLIWVTLGYCNSRGWDVTGAWDELFRSNMSKLQVDGVTGKLKRRDDGKILKPENWQKPNFTPFVNGGQ